MFRRGLTGAVGALVLVCLTVAGVAAAHVGANGGGSGAAAAAAAPGCHLSSAKGDIKHVIYIQFDNTHFLRDNANVPSDLEQMPHLLNFIRGNGTLMTNDHTALISHTATGILTSLTGVYPDRMGQPVSNSYRYFSGSGIRTGVSFAYWTAPLFDPAGNATDTTPTMINEQGKVAPAPWVPYTRAGCDFGAVGTANTILENTAIDIPTVFGPGSPQAQEVASNPAQAFSDFVGIGVHCAQTSSLCSATNGGRPDLLGDEPGGYNGYSGLFGAKYVDPLIFPGGTPTDLNGATIHDPTGHVGFPGFDGMLAGVSLSWVAHMQESGIPVTYAYISDAHDNHIVRNGAIRHFAYGPGEAGYEQQLHEYDAAFAKFFDELAANGINKSNTLFVFTVDEGDHFVGDAPTPAGCDGVTTPCTYNRVGEINADLRRMIRTQFGDTTPFSVHSDDAPTVYINGNPSQTDPATRKLERETSQLSWLNPYTGAVENNIMVAQADRTEMKTLHMVTADPLRTPTYTPFADPNWFFFATSGGVCPTPAACASIPDRNSGADTFAWNHGDIQQEIATTWVGYVGPGVKNEGDYAGWTDHTDVRPTMLTMLGLKDDYETDGRAVVQPLYAWAVPQALRAHRETLLRLGDVYKQLTAPFGVFGMETLKASTRALASGSASDDSTYTTIEGQISSLTSSRDALAAQIRSALNDAEFADRPLNEQEAKAWISESESLIAQATALGGS